MTAELNPTFFGNLSQIPATEIDSRSYSVGAGGSVVLFDGLANYANITKSEDQLEAAEYDLENLKQNLVYQTTDYYYAVLNAIEILKVREENVVYNQKLLETIQERNRLGSIAIADVYAQQVQLGNAQLAQIRASVDYENANSTLLNYLALDVLEIYEFKSPFDSQDSVASESILKDFDGIGVLVGEALSNRKDYMSQQLFVKSRESDLTISNSGLFPSLSGNYGFSTNSVDPGDLFKRRIWNVGLSLNIPIFSNLNTVTNIQLAEIQLKNAEEDLNALGRQIKIEVKQSYLNLVAAIKSLGSRYSDS